MNSYSNDIVLVDDNADNLRLLSNMLKKGGYEVRPTNSGKMALAAIYAKPPILILLDIMMPGMDGFQVCNDLKANEETQEIPVIFISAMDDLAEKVKAFSIGCVDYITKPFQEDEVMARVKTQVKMALLKKGLEEKNQSLEVEITKRKKLVKELQAALENIKILKGLLPICANCKKIKDDNGKWEKIDSYIQKHTEAKFTHGLCPDCCEALYGNEEWYRPPSV
jgi:PleD family two-component response regulator